MADGTGKVIDFNDYIGGEDSIKSAARSLRSLKNDLSALSKSLTDDSGRIVQGLAAVNKGIGDIQAKAVKLNLFSTEDKALLADLAKQLGALANQQSAYKTALDGLNTAQRTVTVAVKEQNAELAKNKQALLDAQKAGDAEAQRKAAAAIRQTTAENKQLGLALRGVNSEFTAAKGSYDALTIANGKLLAQLRGLEGGLNADSKAAQELRGQISANTATLTAFDRQLGVNFRNVGNYPQGLKAVGDGALGLVQNLSGVAFGIAGVAQGLKAFFEGNVEYSRNLAEVRKTTGLTADEAERLADSLKALDTPTSLAGLLKIASVGGQLGIAKGDLLEFTKAIDVAVQALGNDFTGGAEEIATVLGKIGSVYRKELGPDVSQNILAVGSAVNQLGADGAATAPFLTDVALRVGAIAASTKVGLPNVLAYAAVLQETGSTSEVAGTALNRFFSTLTTRTKEAFEIARIANPALTLKEFTRLVNTDFNQAIQVFLKGLREGGKTTTDQARLLATLKLQSGEAKNAIVTLAQNTELFAERQASANTQLRDATSLAAEAAVQNDTLAGSVDRYTNNLKEGFTSGAFSRFLKFLVDLVGQNTGIEVLNRSLDSISRFGQKIGLVDKPLENLADKQAKVVQASYKQITAQEALLKSYTDLGAISERTGRQENEYSKLRQQVLQEFGTVEAKAISEQIARRKEATEANKAELQRNLDLFTQAEDEAARKAAQAQQKLTQILQQSKASSDLIGRIRANAQRGGTTPVAGETQQQYEAAARLSKAEAQLAEAQRQRAQYAAAVALFQTKANEASKDGADATGEETKALEQLDRAALERAKNRKADLQAELAENQRRIAEARAYVEEQGKLFERRQITADILKERIAGAEDIITAAERRGAAIRISLARAEAAEKLVAADNDRIKQSQKKDVSEAELTDIQGQYAARRKGIAREEVMAIEAAYRDLQKKLEMAPLDFKIIGLDANAKAELARGLANVSDPIKNFEFEYEKALDRVKEREFSIETDLIGQLSRREITQAQFDKRQLKNRESANNERLAVDRKFYKNALATQREGNEIALAKERQQTEERLRLIDKANQYAQFAASGIYQIRSNFLEAEAQNEQAAYETSLAAAGENTELKTQIERQHQKELKRLAFERAKFERDAALVSIAINTAAAIAGDIARYGFYGALPAIAGDAAVGLVQAAVVLSKPLPQYFKGRKGGKAEWAEVAERGPELIREAKTGQLQYVAERQVRALGAGDDVFTATETSRMLEAAGLRRPDQDATFTVQAFSSAAQGARAAQDAREGRGYDELVKGQAAIVQAIKTFKPTTVNVHRGSEASVATSQNITHWATVRGLR